MAGTIVADTIQAAATSTLLIQTGSGAPTTAISIDPTQKVTLPVGIDGDLKFNSGYGSVATAYGCRAWVNFDGTANSNLTGTYSQTGTTVTVTATAHGFITGSQVYLDITSGTAVDGTYTVTVISANIFTVQQTSRTTSGNVTLRRNTIRASGNVSSISDNALGEYAVNFSTAMPDANYAAVATTGGVGDGESIRLPLSGDVLTTTSFNIQTLRPGVAAKDPTYVSVAVFR